MKHLKYPNSSWLRDIWVAMVTMLFHADRWNVDPDQAGKMHRLIIIFVGLITVVILQRQFEF